jgi:hypothetical protein
MLRYVLWQAAGRKAHLHSPPRRAQIELSARLEDTRGEQCRVEARVPAAAGIAKNCPACKAGGAADWEQHGAHWFVTVRSKGLPAKFSVKALCAKKRAHDFKPGVHDAYSALAHCEPTRIRLARDFAGSSWGFLACACGFPGPVPGCTLPRNARLAGTTIEELKQFVELLGFPHPPRDHAQLADESWRSVPRRFVLAAAKDAGARATHVLLRVYGRVSEEDRAALDALP